MRANHSTAFYVEALLMIVAFLGVIMMLTGVFGAGRVRSREAGLLNRAVFLAQNGAEIFAGSKTEDELYANLNENGNAVLSETGDNEIRAGYDEKLGPDASGPYLMTVAWENEGDLREGTITVSVDGREDPLYVLETAVYCGEGS